MKDEKHKPCILYVDDEQTNLMMFAATFRHDYTVFTALSADLGLKILETESIEVIVTDQRMPNMTGIEFLLEAQKKHPYPIRIIMTAYTDVECIIQAINAGKIFSYITKPWNEVEVKHILDNAVKLFRLEKSNRELLDELQVKTRVLHNLNETLENKVIERTHALEKSQKELLKTAHLTGMAEVAMGMIHNVSNILNSLNVSASIMAGKIQESELNNLIECNKLLEDHQNNIVEFLTKDPKGSILPKYISQIIKSLQADFAVILNEINDFRKNVQVINEIIMTHQSLAAIPEFEKLIDVKSVVEDALKISGDDFSIHNITVQRDYCELKPIMVNKIKLLQIMINLIMNAKQALVESPQTNKMITLKITEPNKNVFTIEVTDNGIGISSEALKQLFQYGFTTKKTGHGFGLHSSSIAAEEMRGKIEIFSEGENKGTTVSLLLPYQIEAPVSA
jgi:signal transduction histidine kinase